MEVLMRYRFMIATGVAAVVFATGGLAVSAVQTGRGSGPDRDGGPAQGEGPRRGGPGRGEGVRPGGPGRGLAGGGLLSPRVVERLDLTGAQREQVTAIVRGARDEAAPVRQQLRASHRALRQAMLASTPHTGAIATLTAEVERLRQQVHAIHVKATTTVAAVLTAEQREQLRSATQRRRGRSVRGAAI
jgi:Spy/CpxP family protein refolding chaperone